MDLFSGSLSGLAAGIIATLTSATFYQGGLNNFLVNTVQDYAILAGTCSSFGFSLGVSIAGSLLTHKIRTLQDAEAEWLKMYDIDNPLHPWEVNLRDDLRGYEYEGRPTIAQMNQAFRTAKLTAYVGGACSIGLFAVIIPGIMASFPVMDETQFSMWLYFNQIWAVVMAMIVIIAPPAEEVMRIIHQCKRNRNFQTKVTENSHDVTELVVKDGEHMGNSDVTPVHV